MQHYTETHCEMCGQRFTDADTQVEMFNPEDPHARGSLIVHPRCGQQAGWENV
jgi:hypothetical protein